MNFTKNYATTLYDWLSEFATTYREPIDLDVSNPVDNEYITYSAVTGNFGVEFIQPLTIYSKSTAYTKVMEITDKIDTAIGEKGIVLRDDWGYLKIMKGDPFYQDKTDEDGSIRAGYVNLLLTIYQKNV